MEPKDSFHLSYLNALDMQGLDDAEVLPFAGTCHRQGSFHPRYTFNEK